MSYFPRFTNWMKFSHTTLTIYHIIVHVCIWQICSNIIIILFHIFFCFLFSIHKLHFPMNKFSLLQIHVPLYVVWMRYKWRSHLLSTPLYIYIYNILYTTPNASRVLILKTFLIEFPNSHMHCTQHTKKTFSQHIKKNIFIHFSFIWICFFLCCSKSNKHKICVAEKKVPTNDKCTVLFLCCVYLIFHQMKIPIFHFFTRRLLLNDFFLFLCFFSVIVACLVAISIHYSIWFMIPIFPSFLLLLCIWYVLGKWWNNNNTENKSTNFHVWTLTVQKKNDITKKSVIHRFFSWKTSQHC